MLRVPDTSDHLPREAACVANTQAGQQAEQLVQWTLPANYKPFMRAFQASWSALEMYWEVAGSAQWDYAPIGTTYFLEDDRVLFNSQDPAQVAGFLKNIDADFGLLEKFEEAVAHHSRKRKGGWHP